MQTINVASFTKNAEGDIILNRNQVQRGWEEKYYWFPIPFSEIQINKNLQQNPGW